MHVTERYTRVDYNRIDYEQTVVDPKVLTKPWRYAKFDYASPRDACAEYECLENNTAHSASMKNC